MGVSGSGKTTVAKGLCTHFQLPFIEADEAHPKANIKKMQSGHPLNDKDRLPWLQRLAEIMLLNEENGFVLACSALKASYRSILTKHLSHPLTIVHLVGSFELIKNRMDQRAGHFMPSSLLHAQFADLEAPLNAITVSIDQSPELIIKEIILKMKATQPAQLGLIGLGVMGKSLARNFASKGISMAVYNSPLPGEETAVQDFLEKYPAENIQGADSIPNLISRLNAPRKLLLMVKSGDPVDELIDKLLPHLDHGDIIIDAGNSYFKDSIRRHEYLSPQGIDFVGAGVSGGEKGALLGPAIMPAGSENAKNQLLPMLQKIAAVADGKPCVDWVGNDGAGHFVKMVHNGIEYADMQLLTEVYGLYKYAFGLDNQSIANALAVWNDGLHQSYLLDITLQILQKEENNSSLLEQILDVAGHKGTGLWTVKEALDLGVPTPTIAAAMNERILSGQKSLRESLPQLAQATANADDYNEMIQKGMLFARLVALAEGFFLIQQASKKYGWNTPMKDIAQIWRGGCIIRSEMLIPIMEAFAAAPDATHLFAIASFQQLLQKLLPQAQSLVAFAATTKVATPALTATLNYYKSMHETYLPINLIQAQRDYFGAHTYKRLDNRTTSFHTVWEEK